MTTYLNNFVIMGSGLKFPRAADLHVEAPSAGNDETLIDHCMRVRIKAVDGLFSSVPRHRLETAHHVAFIATTLRFKRSIFPYFIFIRKFTCTATRFQKMKFVGAIDQVVFPRMELIVGYLFYEVHYFQ
jgi:hypothetical protein